MKLKANNQEEQIMRSAQVNRTTKETGISVFLDLDGGEVDISTGIGFFDHMLTAFAVHGGFGLTVKTEGDLEVDCHHTVEDTGIVLGKALDKALGDKTGIRRFGSFFVFNADFPQEKCGDYDCCMTEEFMRALCFNSKITLHLSCLYGSNSHHIAESLFKAAARALREAVSLSDAQVSTKGVID